MKPFLFILSAIVAVIVFAGTVSESVAIDRDKPAMKPLVLNPDVPNIPDSADVAAFGAGCFWCVEEVLHQTPGVLSAVSGYMGGTANDANYRAVGAGRTNHAEVVQVRFDPDVISYEELLKVFFKLHDPTQLNRQGPDRGAQYRSVIFYYDDLQKQAVAKVIQDLVTSKEYASGAIVTQVAQRLPFYVAEKYHQNFARLNPGHPYLRAHLYPKLNKFGMRIPMGTHTSEAKGSRSFRFREGSGSK